MSGLFKVVDFKVNVEYCAFPIGKFMLSLTKYESGIIQVTTNKNVHGKRYNHIILGT